MLSNNLHVIISGSRKGHEKAEIISELINSGYRNITLYDCEKEVTGVDDVTKQEQINRLIGLYDWFILVASTDTYGKYTKMEWEALIDSLKEKNRERLVTVLRCSNIDESLAAQHIVEEGDHNFSEFEGYQRAAGISQNFYVEYRYDHDFSDLRIKVRDELMKALGQNQSLRQVSIPRRELKAADVFANTFRTEVCNGYNEDIYIWRESVDAKLESSSLHTIIMGAPAAGKTRAAYQYMKYSKAVGENTRIVNVTRRNLTYVKDAISDFDRWVHAMMLEHTHYDRYILFFDEIIDTLRSQSDIDAYRQIVDIANSLKMRIIATALLEDDKLQLFRDIIISEKVEKVVIPYLSEDDEKVREAVKNTFTTMSVVESNAGDIMDTDSLFNDVAGDAMFFPGDEWLQVGTDTERGADPVPLERASKRNGDVIGEYIQGLKDYHLSVKRNIDGWLRRPDGKPDAENESFLRLFIESYTVIKAYRKEHLQMPLGLILMTIDKTSADLLTRERLNSLLVFLKSNNILEIYNKENDSAETNLMLDRGRTYCYDGEDYHMLVSGDLILHTLNDYIWAYMVSAYGFDDHTNIEKAERAMKMFFHTFHDEAPLTTIRRIINRSHMVRLANRYRAQNNRTRNFLFPYVLEHAKDMRLWDAQYDVMNQLIANVLHVSESFEQLKEDYARLQEASSARFTLTPVSVAEIMGYASNRTEKVQRQIKDFLTEKGWDFESDDVTSLYYHQRQIEFSRDMDTAKAYVEKHLLDGEKRLRACYRREAFTQTADELGLYEFDVNKLLTALLNLCRCQDHISKCVVLVRCFGMINKQLLKRLARCVESTPMSREDNRNLVNDIYKLVTDPQMRITGFDGAILSYYMLCMCNCLANSGEMYEKMYETFAQNTDMRVRCESMMLGKMAVDEYGLFVKKFFEKGKLRCNFSNPTRNQLLSRMIIEVSLSLLPQLFDGTTPESTADQYTLASLLRINSDFVDRARYRDKVLNKKTKHMAFEYLQAIMSLPIFSRMVYHVPVMCQMLSCATTQKQEDYVFEHYIKPSIRLQIEAEDKSYAGDEVVRAEIERRCQNLRKIPDVAIRLLKQKYKNIREVLNLSVDAIRHIRTQSQGYVVDASIVSNTFLKIFDLYTDGYDQTLGENPYLRFSDLENLKRNFISGILKAPFGNTNRSLWDILIKDEYFYSSYFRLYPEVVVEKVDGHYRLGHILDEIPNDYIDMKLYCFILQGVAAIICRKEGSHVPLQDIEKEVGSRFSGFTWEGRAYKTVDKFWPGYVSGFTKGSDASPQGAHKSKTREGSSTSAEIWGHLIDAAISLKKHRDKAKIDWDALLEVTVKAARENPDSMPYINFVFDILKSHRMPPLCLLKLLRVIYLDRGWGIGVTLWKSALESIREYRSFRSLNEMREVGDKIACLTSEYGHLIQENDITQVLQLKFLSGNAFTRVRDKVFAPGYYLSNMSLSLLVHSPDLFENDMIKYLDVMYKYLRNSKLFFGDDFEVTNDFTRFAVEFTKMYSHKSNTKRRAWLEKDDYLDISDILYVSLRANPNQRAYLKTNLARFRDGFCVLLREIKAKTGNDVEPLRALLGGE